MNGTLAPSELARLARDYGASFDARRSVMTLRASIGLEVVYLVNELAARHPELVPELEIDMRVCND